MNEDKEKYVVALFMTEWEIDDDLASDLKQKILYSSFNRQDVEAHFNNLSMKLTSKLNDDPMNKYDISLNAGVLDDGLCNADFGEIFVFGGGDREIAVKQYANILKELSSS